MYYREIVIYEVIIEEGWRYCFCNRMFWSHVTIVRLLIVIGISQEQEDDRSWDMF